MFEQVSWEIMWDLRQHGSTFFALSELDIATLSVLQSFPQTGVPYFPVLTLLLLVILHDPLTRWSSFLCWSKANNY